MPVVIHDLIVQELPPPPPAPAPTADDGAERALQELRRELALSPHRAARARAH